MPPVKRKRPLEARVQPAAAEPDSTSRRTRRATRQTGISPPPLPVPPTPASSSAIPRRSRRTQSKSAGVPSDSDTGAQRRDERRDESREEKKPEAGRGRQHASAIEISDTDDNREVSRGRRTRGGDATTASSESRPERQRAERQRGQRKPETVDTIPDSEAGSSESEHRKKNTKKKSQRKENKKSKRSKESKESRPAEEDEDGDEEDNVPFTRSSLWTKRTERAERAEEKGEETTAKKTETPMAGERKPRTEAVAARDAAKKESAKQASITSYLFSTAEKTSQFANRPILPAAPAPSSKKRPPSQQSQLSQPLADPTYPSITPSALSTPHSLAPTPATPSLSTLPTLPSLPQGLASITAIKPTMAATSSQPAHPPSPGPGQPDRNIDKVVLGKICFRAWYPSYYGKEVLGETAGNTHHGKGPSYHHYHQSIDAPPDQEAGVTKSKGRGKGKGKGKGAAKDAAVPPAGDHGARSASHAHHHRQPLPMLNHLYICPYCFKYSKEIVPWWRHVQACEVQFQIPGEKVYVHPQGRRTVRVPLTPTPPKSSSSRRRKNSVAEPDMQYVEQVEQDRGEWSVWEVDGEKDVLFCQNLSLFAKLFLDNKSVFFDVTGFHYFLLVYTPPKPDPQSRPAEPAGPTTTVDFAAIGSSGSSNSQTTHFTAASPRPHVVGFFSKEKMSWDNNNLACILVFPPWQRKGLGSLLMGVSYEISRREQVLGGPEKPISDLGKKGYKRFWASEIARWLLSIPIGEQHTLVDKEDKGSAARAEREEGGENEEDEDGRNEKDDEGAYDNNNNTPEPELALEYDPEEKAVVFDVADCSRATYILREDCMLVLREMGLVEDAGMGPPKKKRRRDEGKKEDGPGSRETGCIGLTPESGVGSGAADETTDEAAAAAATTTATTTTTTTTAAAAATSLLEKHHHQDVPPAEMVQRVRISQAAVRAWIAKHNISLERACDPAGFIKVYSKRDVQQAVEE